MRNERATPGFCCYARKDQLPFDELIAHLAVLEHLQLISVQADVHIKAGDKWEKEIEAYIDTSQIILLLVSPDFMASNYCYSVEMKRAIKRHELGKAKIIPLILRPTTAWQDTPLGTFQALPSGAEGPKPIVTWQFRDEGFVNISQGIREVVEELRRESPEPIPISPELLLLLNKQKEVCRVRNTQLLTPHLLMALLETDDSRTLYHLDNLTPPCSRSVWRSNGTPPLTRARGRASSASNKVLTPIMVDQLADERSG